MSNVFSEEMIPAIVCGHLAPLCGEGCEVRGFLPETLRDGYGCVSLSGTREVVRSYVDGSRVIGTAFEIRVRCDGDSPADYVDILRLYRSIEARFEQPPSAGCSVEARGGGVRAAIYESGEVEYRAAYIFKYKV